jgi:undecaprenyl-diphosphatase
MAFDYLQILILALIQGAAELLPVSSSAHVIVAARFMGLDPSKPPFVFLLLMLHTGTMFAVIVYFWPRWRRLLRPGPADGSPPRLHFLTMIVLATACTGVLGLGLQYLIENVVLERLLHHPKGEVEELFKSLPLIGASLAAVGVFIIYSGMHESRTQTPTLSPGSAVWVGLVQGLCLPFRGFSRSGATISTALLRGVSRPLAEDFSFALAVVLTPPLLVRQTLKLIIESSSGSPQVPLGAELVPLFLPGLVGMAFSFLAGLVALKVLSAVLERGRWRYFGYYCILAALGVLAAAWYLAGRA